MIKHLRHAFYFFSNHSTICVTIAFCLVTLQEAEEIFDNPLSVFLDTKKDHSVAHCSKGLLFWGVFIIIMDHFLVGFAV